MKDYLQCQGCHRRRSGSSRFDTESTPTILDALVSIVPPMLYGLSIMGRGTHFPLPRAGMLLSDVVPTDATHVSLLTLSGFFPLTLFVI